MLRSLNFSKSNIQVYGDDTQIYCSSSPEDNKEFEKYIHEYLKTLNQPCQDNNLKRNPDKSCNRNLCIT